MESCTKNVPVGRLLSSDASIRTLYARLNDLVPVDDAREAESDGRSVFLTMDDGIVLTLSYGEL